MTKTSKRKVVRTGDTRQSSVAKRSAELNGHGRRPKFGRAESRQRVALRPLTMNAFNQLRDLVHEAIARRKQNGESLSRAIVELLEVLREPRAGRLRELATDRVLTIDSGTRGLVVRRCVVREDVYLQEMEPAGKQLRPVPGSHFMLHADEVEHVARALCEIAGLTVVQVERSESEPPMPAATDPVPPGMSAEEWKKPETRRVYAMFARAWNASADEDAAQVSARQATPNSGGVADA